MATQDRVIVNTLNPLPTALRHYELQVHETLARGGFAPYALPAKSTEGLPGVIGKCAMGINSLKNIAGGRIHHPTLQLWPSLGLLDPTLWGFRSQVRIVFHDPVPIREQFGFDPVSRWLARWASSKVKLLSHSPEATAKLRQLFPHSDIVQALLPIATQQNLHPKSELPSVLVAGQFKPERNLALLEAIGPTLVAAGIQCRIVGRGWPPHISGWQILDQFVTEDRLNLELSRAWLTLLPYKRYFQSAIAVKALENGTATLGLRTGALEELNLTRPDLLLDDTHPAAWVQGILAALREPQLGSLGNRKHFATYQSSVDKTWAEALG